MASSSILMLVDGRGRKLPLEGEILTAGRSVQSDIVLPDAQASRRQFMLRRTSAGWEVSDLDSANGTYVNGRRLVPHQPHLLAPGDRLTVSSLTFTVQATPGLPPAPPPVSASSRQASDTVQVFPAWQWVVAVLVVAGVALAGVGAVQPWVRVDVQFSLDQVPGGQFLGDLLSAVEQAAGALLGTQPLIKSKAIVLGGMGAYGPLVLIAGALALLGLLVDLGLRLSRSSWPGLVYIAAASVPVALIYVDMKRFSSLANQEMLFGVNLLKMLEGASTLLAPKVTPLTGLYLTGMGLGMLLLMGILRCLFPLLTRKEGM